MSNLSQLLQQVIMNGTAPTTTITSDGNGNNKESTKIVWDGGGNVRDFTHNFRPESQGPSITASPTNEQFIQNSSGVVGDAREWFQPVVDGAIGINENIKDRLNITDVPRTNGGQVDGLNAGDSRVDSNGRLIDDSQNAIGGKPWPKFGPDGLENWASAGSQGRGASRSGGSGGRGALGNELGSRSFELKREKAIEENSPWYDPDNILGGGKPPVDQEKLDAEKKAAIKEKFKNVKGGDYSVKAVEESAEQAGQEYQDDLLSRYGDYDFAVQAANERKSRLKRTNQVVMQGFMLDVMSRGHQSPLFSP